MKLTPSKLQEILMQTRMTVRSYPWWVRDQEKYTYQYLNRKQPEVTSSWSYPLPPKKPFPYHQC